MSREIKFRAWDENTNKWLYSLGFLKHGNSKIIMILKDTEDGFITTPVNPDTVGQYTGLKDKNGKEVYEGDVCLTPDGDKVLIEYSVSKESYSKINVGFTTYGYGNDLEIIGNVHENPEIFA